MVALLTIALAIGANTAVFSVVNAALLRSLPFPGSDRLVVIHEIDRRSPGEYRDPSYPNFLDWQQATRSIEGMAAYSGYSFLVETGDTIVAANGARVSWNYFDVLGIAPLHGRPLAAADGLPTSAAVVVISEALWTWVFNRDPAAIGRGIRVNDTPATIVGVVPSHFAGPPDMPGIQDVAELWAPIGRFSPSGTLNGRGSPWITPVVARLRAEVTLEQAQAEIDAVTADLERRYPAENRNRGAKIVSIADQYFGRARPVLWIMLGAVGFVLAIACANLASLLLARGDARQRELAVRAALGAARTRVARLLLIESLTVSILGGALGVLFAAWFIDALVALPLSDTWLQPRAPTCCARYLAFGVTTIRTAGTDHPYVEINLKRAIDRGELPGPEVHLTSPYFNGPQGSRGTTFLGDIAVTDPDQARTSVRYWASQGFGWFKVYSQISKPVLTAIVDEAPTSCRRASPVTWNP